MNEITIQGEASPEALDVKMLARELAAAYGQRVSRYKHELGLTTEEAVAKAEEPCSLSRIWKIQDCPPEAVTWADLEELNRKSPGLALERWEEIKQGAREVLRSGDWAAAVLDGNNSPPWRRACFLATRAELAEGWQPRNGVERQLIDQMAQAQVAMFFWQEQLFAWPSVQVPEAEQLAAMVDRFHKMFLRTLRALCSLRKVPLAVIVQNAGQVNVGQQQVNVAADRREIERESVVNC